MPRRSFLLVPFLFHCFLLNLHAMKSSERTPTCTHRARGTNLRTSQNWNPSILRVILELQWTWLDHHTSKGVPFPGITASLCSGLPAAPQKWPAAIRTTASAAVEELCGRKTTGPRAPFSAEDVEILDVDYMSSKELWTQAFWYVNMSKYGSWGRNRGNHKYDTWVLKKLFQGMMYAPGIFFFE